MCTELMIEHGRHQWRNGTESDDSADVKEFSNTHE